MPIELSPLASRLPMLAERYKQAKAKIAHKPIGMKKLLILLFAVILSSCSKQHINFRVKNSSNIDFDSVVICGLGKLKFESINANSNVLGFIDYSKSKSRTDGAYQIKLYKGETMKEQIFGYYSNGLPLNYRFDIEIQQNKVLIKELPE